MNNEVQMTISLGKECNIGHLGQVNVDEIDLPLAFDFHIDGECE